MDKSMNLSGAQMEALLNRVSGKAGMNAEDLKQAIHNGRVEDFVEKRLDPHTAQQLKTVLSDQKAAENLLNSPAARQLLNNLLKKGE